MHQQVSLGIDVGRNVMRHLPRIVAQPDAAVEGYRTEPDRATVGSLIQHLPEPDVVPAVRAGALGFLEGELFLPSLVIKRTDGCVVVGPVKHHAANDLDAATQG